MISIKNAIAKVRDGYPYPEILDETEDTIIALPEAILKTGVGGGLLLDIGCGAMDKTLVLESSGTHAFLLPQVRNETNLSTYPNLSHA